MHVQNVCFFGGRAPIISVIVLGDLFGSPVFTYHLHCGFAPNQVYLSFENANEEGTSGSVQGVGSGNPKPDTLNPEA